MDGSSTRVQGLAGLVTELDDRLPRTPLEGPGADARERRRRTRPTWLAFLALTGIFLAAGWWLLKPTSDTCEFSETICAIEDLDIDALLLTVPDADLFDVLPAIDEIDPDDSLTLRDVLELDGIRELDPETLLTPTEIDRVLRQLD